MIYLFGDIYGSNKEGSLLEDEGDQKMREKMVKMFTTFAATGYVNCTPSFIEPLCFYKQLLKFKYK